MDHIYQAVLSALRGTWRNGMFGNDAEGRAMALYGNSLWVWGHDIFTEINPETQLYHAIRAEFDRFASA